MWVSPIALRCYILLPVWNRVDALVCVFYPLCNLRYVLGRGILCLFALRG